jgi:hypothetical protein
MSEVHGSDAEVWVPIPGLEGWYSVSSLGRVRSEKNPACRRGGPGRGRVIRAGMNNKGYVRFFPRLPGVRNRIMAVHQAVAQAFLGPCPPGKCVNHKNAIKTDNRLENLEYATPAENIRHAARLGLLRGAGKGSQHHGAKLTEDDVRAIRADATTKSLTEQARQYGVTKGSICRVIKGRGWSHVK